MRTRKWVLIGVAVLALGSVAYVGVAGFLLARVSAQILTVGALAQALGEAPRPDDPLALGYRGDPQTALGLPFQAVPIDTPLGAAEAWMVEAGIGDGLAAIYVHGIAGAREDGYRHLTMLHEAGIPTLLISYRTDPDAPVSPDAVYSFGLSEWADLQAAVDWMRARGNDRLLIVAESMGGGILGQFLRQSPQSGSVAAIALDSPAVDFQAVLAHLARQRDLPLADAIGGSAAQWLALRGPVDLRQARVADIYTGFPGPLFIAHGAGDRIVPLAPSQSLAAARTQPTVTLFTQADHLQSWHEDPARYRAAFTAFLDSLPR